MRSPTGCGSTFQLKVVAGCRSCLARAAVCGVQAVRPPRCPRPCCGPETYVCPNCGCSHAPMAGITGSIWCWMRQLPGTDADLDPQDAELPGYGKSLPPPRTRPACTEGCRHRVGRIGGVAQHVATVLDNSRFFMGSMSTAVGEDRPRRGYAAKRLPLWSSFRPAAAPAGCLGGHCNPDADGKTNATHQRFSARAELYVQRADPPHHKRRDRQLYQAWAISCWPNRSTHRLQQAPDNH